MTTGWLLFTDLDGILLDQDSYDYQPVVPALQKLKESNTPIIPVSSKTQAELAVLMQKLNLDGPVIGENGAVISYPGEEPQIAPPGYLLIRDYLVDSRTNPTYDTLGFGDMEIKEVMEITGLPHDMALLAMQRLGSEAFIWQGNDAGLRQFRLEVARAGLRLLQGRRFLQLLGNTDKGRAIRFVTKHLKKRGLPISKTIGLGDSNNDREMLLAVDIPIIVRKQNGSHIRLKQRPDAIISDLTGPAGWNQVILDLFAKQEE
ncbi:MAG: HAD-IIB family hydrolase [Candidatus Thiodiazotropha sp. (ex Lucinoma borealis)]|nr:HAD-IIB family hydrolase [Candidatus Thiodiazotropha sp. (ex Lucinoma borealis)]